MILKELDNNIYNILIKELNNTCMQYDKADYEAELNLRYKRERHFITGFKRLCKIAGVRLLKFKKLEDYMLQEQIKIDLLHTAFIYSIINQ